MLKSYLKMEKTIIKFGDLEIQIQKTWRTYFKKHVDIDKIVVSNKVPFGKKGFRYLLHIEKTLMKQQWNTKRRSPIYLLISNFICKNKQKLLSSSVFRGT